MEIIKLAIGLLAIISCCHSKPAPEDVVASLIQQFRPYRNDIKLWVDDLINDQDIRPNAEYITCDVCKLGFPAIRVLLSLGFTAEILSSIGIQLCIILKIQEPEICEGIVRSYASPLIYIAEHKSEYQMGDFCGIINPGCAPVNESLTNWTIDIDKNKPPLKNLPLLPADVQPTKILQLTDIHLDVDYIVGTNADCGMPRCCIEAGSSNPNPKMLAGEYGHLKCELPLKALNAMLQHAHDTHKPDYVFLTGDYTHKGIWLYSQEMNGKNIRAVTEAVANAFPDTPTYPLVGNHEPDTVNMYTPEELWDQFDISWMYKNVSAPFTKWLGPEQLETFHKGGYYSVSPTPGLRLVIVNTNLCYVNNFWLAYDPIDPTGQLAWFAKTLLAAENSGEHVLIVGHISPGSANCWPVWSNWFDRIVNRFENIIRGQFYGHAHTEIYTLSFERDTERPTTVMYTAPSGTTGGMNSGYKMYYADGMRGKDSTWEIYDHETWILNTTMSNDENTPIFELLFNARQAFGIPTMRPYLLYELSKQMIFDDEMFEKFDWFNKKGLTTRAHCGTNMNCRMNMICETVIGYSGDESHCQLLRELAGRRFLPQTV